MLNEYIFMLGLVRGRLSAIDQLSLENESLNREWGILSAIEDNLIRIIKITKER